MLNFTYAVKKPQDGAFGNILDDGNWTGMISELQTQEADIGKLWVLLVKEPEIKSCYIT